MSVDGVEQIAFPGDRVARVLHELFASSRGRLLILARIDPRSAQVALVVQRQAVTQLCGTSRAVDLEVAARHAVARERSVALSMSRRLDRLPRRGVVDQSAETRAMTQEVALIRRRRRQGCAARPRGGDGLVVATKPPIDRLELLLKLCSLCDDLPCARVLAREDAPAVLV